MNRRAAFAACPLIVTITLMACGETRRAVGDECLRNDDCLSGYCSARVCVGAPVLVGGPSSPPPSSGSDGGATPDAGIDGTVDAQGG